MQNNISTHKKRSDMSFSLQGLWSDPDIQNHTAKQCGLCFNCLGKPRISDCKSSTKCRKCSKIHHTSLCRGVSTPPAASIENTRSFITRQLSTELKTQDAAPKPAIDSQATSSRTVTTQVNLAETDPDFRNRFDEPVLLKTAVAPIHAGSYTATANIMFDGDAPSSLIS